MFLFRLIPQQNRDVWDPAAGKCRAEMRAKSTQRSWQDTQVDHLAEAYLHPVQGWDCSW